MRRAAAAIVAAWSLLAVLPAIAARAADNPLPPLDLRCEYLADPLGIDVTRPRLSWRLEWPERGQRQTAYRVIVASRPDLLSQDRGDLWDSAVYDVASGTYEFSARLPHGDIVSVPVSADEARWREPGQIVDADYLRHGVLRYAAEGREIVGRNKTCFNNRPLYCVPPSTEGVVLAGDRPFLRLCATPYGFGGFSAAIVRGEKGKWFHE
jgi:hypothetical protein